MPFDLNNYSNHVMSVRQAEELCACTYTPSQLITRQKIEYVLFDITYSSPMKQMYKRNRNDVIRRRGIMKSEPIDDIYFSHFSTVTHTVNSFQFNIIIDSMPVYLQCLVNQLHCMLLCITSIHALQDVSSVYVKISTITTVLAMVIHWITSHLQLLVTENK